LPFVLYKGEMMKHFIRFAALLAAAFLCMSAGAAPASGDYPSKPIRFIVPFPAGGATDIMARLVMSKLTDTLGWQIVFDNKPGAGGTIGADLTAKSPADGYTLFIGQTSNLPVAPALYTKLAYDPVKDFAPITLISSVPIAMTVAVKAPFKTVADLVAAAKAKPDELTFGSAGNGTVGHLAVVLFERTAGVKFIHIPYKGAAIGLPDMIGGRVTFFVGTIETFLTQIKANNIRGLAVMSLKRSPSLPDVPTVEESGYKGFEAASWFGILAPAKTPSPIINRLNTEITKVLATQDIRDRFVDGGGDIKTGPQEFAKLIKNDAVKWAKVVKESGAKVD
jgi:tripartite-type tricarboxylate transporter receptor subunit TctC